jgi:hypothetical protein
MKFSQAPAAVPPASLRWPAILTTASHRNLRQNQTCLTPSTLITLSLSAAKGPLLRFDRRSDIGDGIATSPQGRLQLDRRQNCSCNGSPA